MYEQIIIILLLWEFFIPVLADRYSLEAEWQQVSRTLLSVLSNLNYAVVWMFSTYPLISKSSSPFTNLLVTVPSTPITIGITVIFMYHSLLSFLL